MTEHAPPLGPPPDPLDRPDLSGDAAEAFGRLYDRHARPLHRYLRRRIGPPADDLVAQTFLVALERRSGYDPARGTARAWLYGIATNLLRQYAREEARALDAASRAAGAGEDHEGHDARVADRVDAEARTRLLAAAVAALDPGDRDVLLLTSWAELDSTEIAEALGIPVGTVRSRLHRVRRTLRRHTVDTVVVTAREIR